MKNSIFGLIQLTSPMHVASVDEKGKTTKRPIFGADGIRHAMPVFPANDLRGRLRRKAAKIVIDALAAGDKTQLPLETYMGLQCGTASGQPDTGSLTIEEAVRASKNVYMGTFGGGARVLRSRYSVADLVPVTRVAVEAGCVPAWVMEGESAEGGRVVPLTIVVTKDGEQVVNQVNNAYGMCGTVDMVRRDDVMNAENPDQILSSVKDAAERVSQYQEMVLKTNAARKSEKKDGSDKGDDRTKKADAANMFSAEAIAAGVSLWNDIRLDDDMTLAQLGLLAQSFADLMAEQRLGGLSSKGFGRTRTKNMRISHSSLANGADVPLFQEDGNYTLSPQMAPALEAMRKELVELDLDEMNSYFINRVKEKA